VTYILALSVILPIINSEAEKGKLSERVGRKAAGLSSRRKWNMAAGLPGEYSIFKSMSFGLGRKGDAVMRFFTEIIRKIRKSCRLFYYFELITLSLGISPLTLKGGENFTAAKKERLKREPEKKQEERK